MSIFWIFLIFIRTFVVCHLGLSVTGLPMGGHLDTHRPFTHDSNEDSRMEEEAIFSQSITLENQKNNYNMFSDIDESPPQKLHPVDVMSVKNDVILESPGTQRYYEPFDEAYYGIDTATDDTDYTSSEEGDINLGEYAYGDYDSEDDYEEYEEYETAMEGIKKTKYDIQYHPYDYSEEEEDSIFEDETLMKPLNETSKLTLHETTFDPKDTSVNGDMPKSLHGSLSQTNEHKWSGQSPNSTLEAAPADKHKSTEDPKSWASITYKQNTNALKPKGRILGTLQIQGGYLGSVVLKYGSEWPLLNYILENLYNQMFGARSLVQSQLLKAQDFLTSYDSVASALESTLKTLTPNLKGFIPTIENVAQMIESRSDMGSVARTEIKRSLKNLIESIYESNATWLIDILLKALRIINSLSNVTKVSNS